jgi:flagellar biosynthesis protein FlhB
MNNEFNLQHNFTDEKKSQNGYAIASLVLGIVSILSCCCGCTSILGLIVMGISAILAIVFAFVSKKNADGKMDAKAIAGLVLGIVSIVVLLLFTVVMVGIFTITDTIPQEEMIAFLEENIKPMMEGNEAQYNEFVETIKSLYAE